MLCDAAGEMLGMTRLAMSPGALSERAGAALAESLDCAAAGSVLGAGCGAAGDLVCVAVEWSELCVASDGAAGAADVACAGAGCGDVEAVELAAWEEFVASAGVVDEADACGAGADALCATRGHFTVTTPVFTKATPAMAKTSAVPSTAQMPERLLGGSSLMWEKIAGVGPGSL